MVSELQIRVVPRIAYDMDNLRDYVCTELNVAANRLEDVVILKRSIDARQRIVMVNLKVVAYIDEKPE